MAKTIINVAILFNYFKMNKCLEVWGVYGNDVRHLAFSRENALMELGKLFSEFFKYRDELFGAPDYPRAEERDGSTVFNFEMPDFIEAFLGVYAPQDFASFLAKHLDMQSVQSEAFVKQVKNAEKNYRIAIPLFGGSRCTLLAVNFPVDEINRKIPQWARSKAVEWVEPRDPREGIDGRILPASVIIPRARFRELREKLYSQSPRIIVTNQFRAPVLDDLVLANYLNPEQDFKILRQSRWPCLQVYDTPDAQMRFQFGEAESRKKNKGEEDPLHNHIQSELLRLFRHDLRAHSATVSVELSRGIKQMVFYRDRSPIDLSRFFSDFFRKRDNFLGKPEYDRQDEKDSSIWYNFTIEEFVETFLGTYVPKDFAGFLSQNLDMSQKTSRELVDAVSNADKNYRLAFPVEWEGHNKIRYQLCPVISRKWVKLFDQKYHCNEENKEAHYRLTFSLMMKKWHSMNDGGGFNYGHSHHNGLRPDLAGRNFFAGALLKEGSMPSVRRELLRASYCEQDPAPILIIPFFQGPRKPNLVDIISYYQLPREGLEIVKA